jgi:ribosomal protein S6
MEDLDIQEGGRTVYELGYLVLPSIPEDNLSGVVGNLKAAISKHGGEVFDGEDPFKQDLAYTMSKVVGASRYVVSDAYIGWLKFDLEPSKALVVKAEVEKQNEILRFLLIRAPRETSFTFAQALAKLEEKEEAPVEAGEPVKEVVE